MLASLYRPCPRCANDRRRLKPHTDARYTDGYRLRCSHCRGDWPPRHGSFFFDFKLPLVAIGRLVCYFDAHLLVHQVENLTEISRKTISKFYARLRVRMRDYIAENPIAFQRDEIVEIDELFIGALRIPPNREGEGGEWPPILGMIGRQSDRVVLEIVGDKSARSARAAFEPHLASDGVTIISDRAQYFRFLRERHHLHQVEKVHQGSATWPLTKLVLSRQHGVIRAHTNTIEGYWSQLRRWLHASHGWPADYLPLFLSECSYRSLRIPLTTALQPA